MAKLLSWFLEYRLDGLVDETRPGRPATITAEQIEDVVITTLELTSDEATHSGRAKMAERTGLSNSAIADLEGIWHATISRWGG